MYEKVKVPVPRDVMMLKALALPVLIKESMLANTKMTMIALTGTSKRRLI